jgi:hypothetical protein
VVLTVFHQHFREGSLWVPATSPHPSVALTILINIGKPSGMFIFEPSGFLATRIKSQQLRPQPVSALPTFYRNIEKAVEVRRDS